MPGDMVDLMVMFLILFSPIDLMRALILSISWLSFKDNLPII